jgi:hypothetical protein
VTVHAILVIYQDQVDAFHALEHSIFTAKPASPIVQLGSIHLPMSVWDVTPHAILVIYQDLVDVYPVMELSISIAKLASPIVQLDSILLPTNV